VGTLTRAIVVAVVLVAGSLAAAITFGGPGRLPPHNRSNPFAAVDFSALPAVDRFGARDGTPLAYRAYANATTTAKGSIVLIHGSSSRGDRMHPLATGCAAAGYVVYTLDMRGHGDSGAKGHAAYIGQLEDDLEDFVNAMPIAGPKSLVGFSAGGGFALRFAADDRRELFDNYVLLAPLLGQSATTYRPAGGGWASVGMPRIVALSVLDGLGISALNRLPVVSFAVRPEMVETLTPHYDLALARNFGPHLDYRADIAAATQPMEVLVAEGDEQFYPEHFAAEFSAAGRTVPVSIVPGVGSHIDMTLAPAAIAATTGAVDRLNERAARP
jgi:alpha-beta hydrolase superfamily lysophospholipase